MEKCKDCPKCGAQNGMKAIALTHVNGEVRYSYRCTRCRYEELASAVEIIHKSKTDVMEEIARNVHEKCIDMVAEIHSMDEDGGQAGTCFSIGSGYFVTNAHVVLKGGMETKIYDKILVKPHKYHDFVAGNVVSYDEESDLALIGTDIDDVPAFVVNTKAEFGEMLYLFGNTKGLGIKFKSGLYSNYIAIGDWEYMQCTMMASNGDSGGPVVNKYGELVGIGTMFDSQIDGCSTALVAGDLVDFIDNINENLQEKIVLNMR